VSSSRVVFVGAISIILGFYVYGFRSADVNHQSVAYAHLFQLQANQIALSGIDWGVNIMPSNPSGYSLNVSGKPYFGGELDIRIEGISTTEARIRATGKFKTHEAKIIAIVKKHSAVPAPPAWKKKWNQWAVETVYPDIRKKEFEDIFTNLKRYATAN